MKVGALTVPSVSVGEPMGCSKERMTQITETRTNTPSVDRRLEIKSIRSEWYGQSER